MMRVKDTNETWLMKWENTYKKAIKLGIPGLDNNRAQRDFLDALEYKDKEFAKAYEVALNIESNKITLNDLIEAFRRSQRRKALKSDRRSTSSHSAFATLNGRDQQGRQTQRTKPIPECYCGERHFWSKCLYIMDFKRPENSVAPNAETYRKVQKTLAE